MVDLSTRAARRIGRAFEEAIRIWVQTLGKPVPTSDDWLRGPMGPEAAIGRRVYRDFAFASGLAIQREQDAGLLEDFRALRGQGFNPQHVDPRVREFYEHTARYELGADPWWSPLFRPLGRTIIHLVSRNIDQLILPMSRHETKSGITNEIYTLHSPDGTRRFTGWLRRLVASGETVYAGFYSIARPPHSPDPCVRVIFPLPRGNAIVFLRPEAQPDGSFRLDSSGRGYGDPGFYRVVDLDGEPQARYIRAFRESFHVYPSGDALATDHTFAFHALEVFRLHYRILRRPPSGEMHA